MCGRYQFSADEYKEIRQIVRDAQRRSEGNELNFPMAGDICPSQVAPVLVSRGEKIVGEFQQWGLPGFRGRQQIINARAETVTEKPMFRRSVAFQRCVIPATGFYEWDSAKHKYFFQMPGQPIYLAGIYDNINGVNCFIILTTIDLQAPFRVAHQVLVVGVGRHGQCLVAAVAAPILFKAVGYGDFFVSELQTAQLSFGAADCRVYGILRFCLQFRKGSIAGAVGGFVGSFL